MGFINHTRTGAFKSFVFLGLIAVLGIVWSCAGTKTMTPTNEYRKTPSVNDVLGLEKDKLQDAYTNFLMATLSDSYGHPE